MTPFPVIAFFFLDSVIASSITSTDYSVTDAPCSKAKDKPKNRAGNTFPRQTIKHGKYKVRIKQLDEGTEEQSICIRKSNFLWHYTEWIF